MIALSVVVIASPMWAQASAPRIELGAQISHFPEYVAGGAGVRRSGPSVLLRIVSARANAHAYELAFTHVAQPAISQSAAPRLDLLRLAYVLQLPLKPTGRVGMRVALGGAGLRIDAPEIDCGESPLCDEWVSRDSRLLAAAGGVGLWWRAAPWLSVQGDTRGYLPFGTWTPAGWRSLREVALGAALRF